MNTYKIEVSCVVHDLLRTTIEVEADSRAEALIKVHERNETVSLNLEYVQQVDAEAYEYEIVEGPVDAVLAPPTEEHTRGEWEIVDTFWVDDETVFRHGGQRFVSIGSDEADCAVALVHADEDDPEAEPNARLIKAAPKMLAQLRIAVVYCNSLNVSQAEGGMDRDCPRPPDGDDFNEIMSMIETAIAAYEEGGKS